MVFRDIGRVSGGLYPILSREISEENEAGKLKLWGVSPEKNEACVL